MVKVVVHVYDSEHNARVNHAVTMENADFTAANVVTALDRATEAVVYRLTPKTDADPGDCTDR